jgi:NAD(P)-dependent dehydrogenase (short-subunit alcohol dehydrogenase family)
MNQRVLVTAGASGIGREIARTFAANGAKVFVSDIDAKALEALSKEIKGVMTKTCDNSKRSDVEALIPAAVEALGGLDVLVNNAGISGPTAPVEAIDPDKWEAVMNVNLNGTFNVTRLAIPHLKKSAAGNIIIMSSLGGRFGYPNRSPYCTSKWDSSDLQKRWRLNWALSTFARTRSRPALSAGNASSMFSKAEQKQKEKRWSRKRKPPCRCRR